MAIDYYGRFPCKVRDAVDERALLNMEKARNRAEAVIEMMRADTGSHNDLPPSEWTFDVLVRGPEGEQRQTVRVGDLLQTAAPLAQLASHCEGCPFQFNGWDFGCGGAINYPISAAAENWLMSCLPDNLDSHAGKFFVRAINDYGFDGVGAQAARQRGDIFESPQAAVRKWGSLFSKKTAVTSNQIFHMLFGVGHLSPIHAKSAAHILGFVDEAGQPVNGAGQQANASDDDGTRQMKAFLRVAAAAGTRGTEVFVDS